MTKEEAKWAAENPTLVKAFAEGRLQESSPSYPEWHEPTGDEIMPTSEPRREKYRVKPEPKRVPLAQEELLEWLRPKHSPGLHYRVLAFADGRARIAIAKGGFSYDLRLWDLVRLYEMSSDRKTWRPCWKEVSDE